MTALIIIILLVFSLSLGMIVSELVIHILKLIHKKPIAKDMLRFYRTNLVRTLKEAENGTNS